MPADCEDDLAVLRAACRAWGLSLPNLVVSVEGGQACPENWWYWLMNESVWKSGLEGNDDQAVFNDSVKQIYVGVAKACAESKAWVYSWNDCLGCEAGFEGKTEIFGQARRSAGLNDNEVVHLAAFHEGCVHEDLDLTLTGTGSLPLWGFEKFADLAVPVPKEGEEPGKEPEMVVTVPDMKNHYCESRTLSGGTDKYLHFEPEGLIPGLVPKAYTVPQGQVTHLILHEKGCRLPRSSILDALQKLIPCPVLVANGSPHMLPVWVQESHKNPVIILRHTGGAADVLAEAVLRSRTADSKLPASQHTFTPPGEKDEQGKAKRFPVSYTLSKGARESQFVVLDAHKDTTERVVDKLIQCMSMVDDDETRSLGFHRLELVRLQEAWGLFLRIAAASRTQILPLARFLLTGYHFRPQQVTSATPRTRA